ncbi:MAG: peroxidase-related enzyme [Burkholderiaceae bacterium]
MNTPAVSTARPISRYPIPALADLPDDIRERILGVQEKAGFVPNVFVALAHRPAEFRAFFAYHDALMDKQAGNLSKAEREMIVTATSARNRCLYCVVAHGALVRVYSKQPLLADQVAVNHAKADITERQKAMLDFAIKVCVASDMVDDADYAVLHGHGFDDEDIWDITAITAFFGLSNRVANVTGMRPNDEFYLIGRVPRQK